MKFITTTITHTQQEVWEEIQPEPDTPTSQKSPFPSYAETVQKEKRKRK